MESSVKLVVFLAAALASLSAQAADIAACSDPSGKGYFPETGIVKKADSGWADEKISGGIINGVRFQLSALLDLKKKAIQGAFFVRD